MRSSSNILSHRQKQIKPTATLTSSEIAALKVFPPTPVSQWAEENRVIAYAGQTYIKYKMQNLPYVRDIIDCFNLHTVREIIVMKAPQVGMTEAMLTCMLYTIERDPEIILYVMPNEVLARKMALDRIHPAIANTPNLKPLLSRDYNDNTGTRIRLKNGCIVYLAWAHSVAALSSFSVKYLFLDEVDKYPFTLRREADPIALSEKRVIAYPDSYKIFKVSTPTKNDGHIYKAYEKAELRLEWISKCPVCGHEFVIGLDHLKYETDNAKILWAGIECPQCKTLWDRTMKQQAVAGGRWEGMEKVLNGEVKSIAFHIPAWLSPFVSLEDIAKAHWSSEKDSIYKQDFYNNYLGLPYDEVYVETSEDNILKLRDDRPSGLVPSEPIACLIASFDTQHRGFYYEIRAWGFGYAMESWMVEYGYVQEWEDVYKIMRENYWENAKGEKYAVSVGFIDSGAGSGEFGVSRTVEVYDFCRQMPNLYPLKGMKKMANKFKVSIIDHYPRSAKPIPGGLRLYIVNVSYYKDYLASKLKLEPTAVGAWHLHSEANYSYARQLTAEYKDSKGNWVAHRGRANHYWDCAVYNLACADIFGVRHLKISMEEAKAKAVVPEREMLRKWVRKSYKRRW